MALSCILRGVSMKLKLCPLQSLTRGHVLKCSTVTGSSHFHQTFSLQQPLYFQKEMTKQNISCAAPPHALMVQNVKQFSLSAKQMASQGHDHTKLWAAEKVLSVSLLGIVPLAFLIPSQFMDYLLAVTVVMHNHWGIEAIVVDYVRPVIFGNVIPKIALGAVYLLSIVTLAGLLFFITNDVGIVLAIKQFWKL